MNSRQTIVILTWNLRTNTRGVIIGERMSHGSWRRYTPTPSSLGRLTEVVSRLTHRSQGFVDATEAAGVLHVEWIINGRAYSERRK